MRQLSHAIATSVLLAVPHQAAAAAPGQPGTAADVIAAVHVAASRKDFDRLRDLMAPEFIWSLGYGAEATADHAIAAWREDPEAVAALREAASQTCGYVSPELIQCPLDAGVDYRAGFTNTSSGWRLSHFLAGD